MKKARCTSESALFFFLSMGCADEAMSPSYTEESRQAGVWSRNTIL
jgi:hypothetical protein